jgi:amino acid transporter
MGGWVGPRAVLDAVVKREMVHLVAQRYATELFRLLVTIIIIIIIITTTTTTTTTTTILLLYDKENKEVDLINIAVPLPHNMQNVCAQKINKYAELATGIQQMWNVQTINIRPMVISATGIVPQHLKTQLSE